MVEHRRSDATGQTLAGLKQTSIPGNDDASVIKRGFAQKPFIGTRCQMNPWLDRFLIPTGVGANLDGRTSKK